jgi:hypothetical protein
MAIQTMVLDPNAQGYANLAALDPTAASKLAGIAAGAQVNPANLAALDSTAASKLANAIITSPTTGQFKVVALQRDSTGKLAVSYDDVAQ